MKKLIFVLITLAGSAGLAAAADISTLIQNADMQALPAGTSIVDFSLHDLSGNNVRLSDFSGKVVLLNFWATWCPPCRAEIPQLESLYKEYKDKGLVVLGVDLQEAPAGVRDFVSKNKMTYPVLLDTSGQIGGSYGVRSIPTTYLVDKQGNVTSGTLGSRDWVTPSMKALLDALLGK